MWLPSVFLTHMGDLLPRPRSLLCRLGEMIATFQAGCEATGHGDYKKVLCKLESAA